MSEEGFTVEGAQTKLDGFIADLTKLVPNPGAQRLLEINREYTPPELRSLLQQFSSYLSTLYGFQGRIEAESILINEAYKTGSDVAILDSIEGTITAKKARLIKENPAYARLRRLEIQNDAYKALLAGWIKSYESAYTGVSRIITLTVGELGAQSSRFT